MAEQPATIAREAKTLHTNLKELLQTKEPFDRDVDFQRKNLRRHYLNLLLVHPYARESKDVENHLWMQTSYAFISSYKTRIAALDRAILQNARQQQQQRQAGQQQPQAQNQQQTQAQGPQRTNPHHGVVEYRKLIQRFRQFLAEEEKFWTLLIQRMYRTFGLTEAKPVLAELGILSESQGIMVANTDPNPEGGEPTHPSGGRIQNGRNHYQFPQENSDPNALLPSTSNRGSRLAIFSKALVCLGDIARYRELYNDSNGRPRAGHDSAMPARRRNRRGQEIVPRARNYDKAQKCYEQARLLVPNEGNPWHQLAILSSYQKDTFVSLVYYYRALCVQQPYDTATDNLNTVLSRALDTWKGRNHREREKPQDRSVASNILVETLRERLLALHALWRIGEERGIEKMDSIGRKLDQLVRDDFDLLVSERLLLPDTISQIIVLSQGAFCKHRMIRPKTERPTPANTSLLLDWHIIRHIFDLHGTLLNVGKAELTVPPPSDVDVNENGLALKITAVFRRTLPALRIASKWLRANSKTLMQDLEYLAFLEQERVKGIEVLRDAPHQISGYSIRTIEFWKSYVAFIRALAEAFPKSGLPALVSPLDEDIDMRGFLPLKKLMGENLEGDNQGSPQAREKPHPNVEQLMRIYDLLEDARLLAELPNFPIKLEGNTVVLDQDMVGKARPSAYPDFSREPSHERPSSPQLQQQTTFEPDHDEIDIMEEMSPGEEDVIDEAFRARDKGLLDREFDDEDEEKIVYLQPTLSPVLKPQPPTPLLPIASIKPITSPTTLSPKSPTNIQRHTIPLPSVPHAAHTTTAEDLLKGVMKGTNNRSELAGSLSLFPQNIWSASPDEQSLISAAGGNPPKNTYKSPRQYQNELPQSWSSSFTSGNSQLGQQNTIGTALTTRSLAQPLQHPTTSPGLGDQYQQQRLSSLSSPAYQAYPVFNQITSHDHIPLHSPLPISRPAPAFSSPQIMNSSLFGNGLDAPVTFAAAFGNPLASPPTSPRYGGGSVSPHGHARQMSYEQAQHLPHYPHKMPMSGQPFASMPQTW